MKGISFVFILLLFLFFAGCEFGTAKFAENEIKKIELEKKQIEENKSKQINIDDDNYTVKESIIVALNNLGMLKSELNNLEGNIDNISIQLNETRNDPNLNAETKDYLDMLTFLIDDSRQFLFALDNSTTIWNGYLYYNLNQNVSDMNFNNYTTTEKEIFEKSMIEPMKAFD